MPSVLISLGSTGSEADLAERSLPALDEGGLSTIVLGSASPEMLEELGAARLPLDERAPADGPLVDDLTRALAAGGGHPAESFLICDSLESCLQGDSLGMRTVLVLGERSLDEAVGPGEPANKTAAVAVTLEEALRYVDEEHRQARSLGAFPYGPAHAAEERAPVAMPSGGDLAKIFGLIVVAGLAVALGIAYLLQEVYQSMQFPRIFYYLTLQFIPQTVRGLMFLLIGTGAGLLLPRLLSGFIRPRRSYR